MLFPEWLSVYGDPDFRGKCPLEEAEQITFFNKLRREYPESYGLLALHPKNESKRKGAQFRQLDRDKSLGMSIGASDIILPGNPAFVVEMKRKDHTQCRWQPKQLEYLEAAHSAGCFVGVALGWEAAWEAFNEWLSNHQSN